MSERFAVIAYEQHLRRMARERRGKDTLALGLALSVILNFALVALVVSR